MLKNYIEEISKSEKQQIAIDFDGVIHKNSQGFKDGTIYDEPIKGAIKSIEYLKRDLELDIVIFSCKARPDRPLINGKTGIDLIWEWFDKHNIKDHIKEVTYKKPNAIAYIDDKGVKFDNWKDCIKTIEKIKKRKK